MTVAGVEAELAEMLAEAARVYGDPERGALKLRTMLMQYDTVEEVEGRRGHRARARAFRRLRGRGGEGRRWAGALTPSRQRRLPHALPVHAPRRGAVR